MLYLDTSVLLPFYRTEASSAAVEAMLTAQREPPLVSRLGELELASALARWVRARELTEAQAHQVGNAFRDDIRAGRFRRVDVPAESYDTAAQWLLSRKTGLRVLDALHLACTLAHEAELVTGDKVLLRAAQQLGIPASRPGP